MYEFVVLLRVPGTNIVESCAYHYIQCYFWNSTSPWDDSVYSPFPGE